MMDASAPTRDAASRTDSDARPDSAARRYDPRSALVDRSFSGNDARTRVTLAPVTARSGRAPTMRAVAETLRRQLSSSAVFAAQGAFNALGGGRFVAVVQRTDRGNERSPTLLVLVASELDGAAQIEGFAEVPTLGVWQGAGTSGCDLTVMGRELRDLDNDGEPELSLAIEYCSQPVCPTGVTQFRYLVVYDLDPAPRVAVMVERAVLPQSEVLLKRQRTTRWRDVDRDGHPDLLIEGTDCELLPDWRSIPEDASAASRGCVSLVEGVCCVQASETVLYDPREDLWHPGGDGAELASPAPCGGAEGE